MEDGGVEQPSAEARSGRVLRTVNVTWAKSHLAVLRRALPAAGLRLVESPCAGDASVRGDIVWVVTADDVAQRAAALKAQQWLSHVPGLPAVCSKQGFAAALAAAGEDLAWAPKTWMLPAELQEVLAFCERHPRQALMYKPSEAGMGEAVFLVMGRADAERKIGMMRGSAAVAQRYIERPLLIDGRKCDLRLYVALVVPAPGSEWHALLFQEGLVRICADPYAEPSRTTLHQAGVHLTNTSISSLSGSAELCVETLAQLAGRLGPARWADTWEAICVMLSRVLGLCRRQVAAAPCRCFQILGVDVLLDEELRPHMLELNDLVSLKLGRVVALDDPIVQELGLKQCRAPCFNHRAHAHAPSELDELVKIPLVTHVLTIARRAAAAAAPSSAGSIAGDLVEGLPFDIL